MSTTRTKPNLCEIVTFGSAPIINEETGVIEGVKILGENSKNGRRYKPEAMREAAPLYEGVKSYINHPRKSELSDDRDFAKWSGIFEGVHYLEGKGLFGNFRLRKEGPHFREIIEAARDFPQHAGFSHVAEGKSRREGNTEIVESIREVFSVDLVTDPATTKGFFESEQKVPRKMKTTLKELIEATPEATQGRKLLVEAVEAKSVDGSHAVEHDDDASDALKVLAAIESIADKLNAAPVVEPVVVEDPELTKKVAMLEAKTMLLESGREATDIRVKALAACEEADRAALLESWAPVEVTNSRRPTSSPPLNEATDDDLVESYDPATLTTAQFASRLR